jgi:hypothetical protein
MSSESLAVQQKLPPIVGSTDLSASFMPPMYLGRDMLSGFVDPISEGFWLLFDVQSDTTQEQTIISNGVANHQGFSIQINSNNIEGSIRFLLRDGDGKLLDCYSNTSRSRSKRVMIWSKPKDSVVKIYELQPWSDTVERISVYLNRDNPCNFGGLDKVLILGGINIGGSVTGTFSGKLGNIALGCIEPPVDELTELSKSIDNPSSLQNISETTDPTRSMRQLFLDDVSRLIFLATKNDRSSDQELRDASVILFRWLCDGKDALIRRLCNSYGIQFWLPGQSEDAREYRERVLSLGASIGGEIFYAPLQYGSKSLTGFEWVTLDKFISDVIIDYKSSSISISAFIKMIRNKLGGGHYDEEDRKLWQRELVSLSEEMSVMEHPLINYQMHSLISGVLEGIDACRLEFIAS